MKNTIKSALFFAIMLALAVGCQSKKTESAQTTTTIDTATVTESETIVKGDSMEIITDTAKVVMPDTTRK